MKKLKDVFYKVQFLPEDAPSWLIKKQDAHVGNTGELIMDNPRARAVLKSMRGKIVNENGNFILRSVSEGEDSE